MRNTEESDRAYRTGVGYGLRHTVSGRWYCGRGRYRSDGWPYFDGPQAAMRDVQKHLRESEIAFFEAVPMLRYTTANGPSEEAQRLLDAGPQPLLQPV